mgnify:CR=1 FL=1
MMFMNKIIYYINFLFLFISIFFIAFNLIYFREVRKTESQLGLFLPLKLRKGFVIYALSPTIVLIISLFFILKGM